jgi:hypothetical protein
MVSVFVGSGGLAMAFLGLRRTGRKRSAALAALGAGAALAGGAVMWLVDAQDGSASSGRAREALRGATRRARSGVRDLAARASHALHEARERAERRTHGLVDRAREVPRKARGLADELGERARALSQEAKGRLGEAVGSWPGPDGGAEHASPRTAAGISGAVLIARGLLGRGILRGPSGLLGATVIARVLSESEPVRRRVRQATELVRRSTGKLRAARAQEDRGGGEEGGRIEGAEQGERGATSGAASPSAAERASGSAKIRTRTPEVHEVKSPTELEPGVASASPEPLVPGRADRSGPHRRGRGRTTRRASSPASGEEQILAPPTTDDVAPPEFDAPPPGAEVRPAELGVVLPHEVTSDEEGTGPVLGPDAEPASPGASDETGSGSPRIAGAGDEPAPSRKAADEADTTRRDPTSDGG